MTREKELRDFICVEINTVKKSENTSAPYRAGINCPYCSKQNSVSFSSSLNSNGGNGKRWWNMSNFDRHLKTHLDFFKLKREKDCEYCSFRECFKNSIFFSF